MEITIVPNEFYRQMCRDVYSTVGAAILENVIRFLVKRVKDK